ncbi:MAG: hypothetical protein RLZZ628_162 [Bacteroidota bacterium]|jgi:uncharacterized protein YbaP (TraB family)
MKKNKKSLIWSFQQEGSEKISYLIGTMHVRDARAFTYQNLFFQKILSCDAFATEFNLDEAAQNFSQSALMLPEGVQLKNLFTEKWYERITALFEEKVGSDLLPYDALRPILLVNILTEAILLKDAPQSLDETLWLFAKQNAKKLMGIETMQEQMDILQQMDVADQVKQVKDIARNFARFRKTLLRMTALYEEADIQALYETAKRSVKGNRKLLLYDRNERMAREIVDIHAQHSICAAVGAGHLAGKKGILRLLKLKGFNIQPVF